MQVFEVVLQFQTPEQAGFMIPAENVEKAVAIAKTLLPSDTSNVQVATVKEVIYNDPITLQ
jgi:hypothetical protein